MDTISASPLCWPQGWQRSVYEVSSRFGHYTKPISIAKAVNTVLDELRKMGIDKEDVIISTDLQLRNDGRPRSNQRQPDDKGASVWWKDGEKQQVIALDKYDTIADNIYAIGKTIEAMRGIERWGSGEILERTFTGFQALTDQSGGAWWAVLGVDEFADNKEIIAAYKYLRSKYHPDKPDGDRELFEAVQKAYGQWGKS